MTEREHLIKLADEWATYDRVTHWAISMRLTGKGDFFHGLMRGAGVRMHTYRKVVQKFSDRWPDNGLQWPSEIPRPAKSTREAA